MLNLIRWNDLVVSQLYYILSYILDVVKITGCSKN